MPSEPFIVGTRDYVTLDTWPFGWRFADSELVDIPVRDRDEIRPFSETAARLAWDYAAALHGQSYRDRFRETAELQVDGRGSASLEGPVSERLDSILPATTEQLFVSWTERMAAESRRDFFVRHWSAFCFPVEDVVIWPQDVAWVLAFDYKQRFYFALSRDRRS